ncbi:hypothetical protein [Methylobacterium sp. Leaf106]|uniref:hypothetical protein n=1 Tax=Methylobacterium sp. Leaf106 TaxID=1736255 RepID=UPI0006F9D3A1|nr:hypothetical protein [Methylobacterium sp. Leaf106]KQP53077.1 hypothetical protein ASF34_01530 [Methylobacterium sp. Leaf106]
MSSAETAHPIEWRDDGAGGETAVQNGEAIGSVRTSAILEEKWVADMFRRDAQLAYFPTASAARSFVEKSVKEAGHGE